MIIQTIVTILIYIMLAPVVSDASFQEIGTFVDCPPLLHRPRMSNGLQIGVDAAGAGPVVFAVHSPRLFVAHCSCEASGEVEDNQQRSQSLESWRHSPLVQA